MPFATAMRIFDVLGFILPPSNETAGRALYNYHRHEAQAISTDFRFARSVANGLDINPIYDWVVHHRMRSSDISRVDSMMDEMRRPLLRKSLDLLIYIGWSPQDIAEALNNKIDAPVQGWDEADVAVYRKFFWDESSMTVSDWERYLGMWKRPPVEYVNRHVFNILESSREELLWMAGIVDSITPQQMTRAMMLECFMQFRKHANADAPDATMMLKHIDAFRKLAVTAKVLGDGDESAQDTAKSILDGLTIMMTEKETEEPMTRSDLGEDVVVSQRESTRMVEVDAPPAEP